MCLWQYWKKEFLFSHKINNNKKFLGQGLLKAAPNNARLYLFQEILKDFWHLMKQHVVCRAGRETQLSAIPVLEDDQPFPSIANSAAQCSSIQLNVVQCSSMQHNVAYCSSLQQNVQFQSRWMHRFQAWPTLAIIFSKYSTKFICFHTGHKRKKN